MLKSSRSSDRGFYVVAPSVTDQGPQDVDASAGESQHGLGMAALRAFAVVELPRVEVGRDAHRCRGVEDPLQAPVIALRAVEVAADLARVAWRGGHSREGGEVVRAGERVQAAADGDEELGAEDWADAGQGLDHFGEFVLAKLALDELVGLGDLLVEGHHLLREGEHHPRDGRLAGDCSVLPFGGRNGLGRQSLGSADLPVAQPGGQPALAGAADRGRGLVARQEQQRPIGPEVQGAFQGREHAGQQGPQAVDGAGAFGDQVDAAFGQQPQFDGGVVVGADRLQITPRAGLVGYDAGVPGVGLALASVAVRGPVDHDAGDVDQLLAVVDEQHDRQCGFIAGHVHRLGDSAAVGEVEDVADQFQQLGLVIGDPPRQQGLALGFQDQGVVVGFAAVGPGPYPAHRAPARRACSSYHRRPRRHCSTQRPVRSSQSAAESSWGAGRPSFLSYRRQPHESHTQLPWVPQPYEWLGQTQEEGGAA